METSRRDGKLGFQRARTVRTPSVLTTRSRVIFENSPSNRDSDPKYESWESLNSSNLVGTCPDMCPAKERAQRERLRDLAVFERLNGNPGKTSPSLAVKKNTLEYLLNLVDSSEHPFEVVHDFVFDRTRSIRQDLSMQKIINEEAVEMYEEMTNRTANSEPKHHAAMQDWWKIVHHTKLYHISELIWVMTFGLSISIFQYFISFMHYQTSFNFDCDFVSDHANF